MSSVLRLTRRGWLVIAAAAFAFGIATGDWTYYKYETPSSPATEEYLP